MANYVTTALFCFELVIKMVGYTFWGYMSDGFNVFDLGMVLLSLLDIFFLSGGGLQALRALRSLRVIRSLRVLRIFKMFKYLQSLKKIGDVIMQARSPHAAAGLAAMGYHLRTTKTRAQLSRRDASSDAFRVRRAPGSSSRSRC